MDIQSSLVKSLLSIFSWLIFWPIKLIGNMWGAFVVQTSWLVILIFSILYLLSI